MQERLRRTLRLARAAAATAASAWALAAAPAGAPGLLVQRAFCAPTFTVDGTVRASGSGFLLYGDKYPRRTFLFTADHLFGVPAADLPSRVTAATCAVAASKRTVPAGAALKISGAHPMGPLAELEDVAVFPVVGRSFGLSLAETDVAPGEVVWLMARVKAGAERAAVLHRAVAGSANGYLIYRYDDQRLDLDQTSGAAVLNGSGEVVGLNVGYARGQSGLIGVANGLSTLRRVVDQLP